MSTHIMFREEVGRALAAGVMMALQSDGGRNVEYLRGVMALARHQALALGLDWEGLIASPRESPSPRTRGKRGGDDGGPAAALDRILGASFAVESGE